ncbi:MAG: ATP-dependent Clp protease ATP-binding subunit ClpX [Chloroflexi bacterium]|nr:ATP-dependent Clp protease ATP-binding subunit ClpX [Chloroflexota bacterium]
MADNRNGPGHLQCSFCEKAQARSNLVLAGQGRAAVCYECIQLLGQLVEEEGPKRAAGSVSNGPLVPRDIYSNLETYVIGQERAKKILSVAVYNHFKRIWNGKRQSDVELQKTNILLMGPTGCGKTLLAETLAQTLDVPFAVCDATSLTESGYVGEDVENILLRLIQAADWDVPRAEHGIVYIDELDKIARKEGVNRSITRDVSGEGVQQELLKIIEGCVANVPPQGGRKHPHQEFLQINTRNILFICGGAFDGLDEIVCQRLGSGSPRLGFLADNRGKEETESNSLNHVTPEDLLQFGFIPELVGRLPVTVCLESLDRGALIRVLTEPKNAIIKQYQQLFSMDGVELEFTQEGLEAAAERALDHHTGARCLRYVIEDTLLNVMYELPSLSGVSRCVVEEDAIMGASDVTLVMENAEPVPLPSMERKSA